MLIPSMVMLPECASITLNSDIMSVLLPQPVLPAIPTCITDGGCSHLVRLSRFAGSTAMFVSLPQADICRI